MAAPSTTPMFTFDDVWVRAGALDILRGVTTTIAAEGITVIRGSSGSGKSTLLRLCNRLVVPSAGTIRLLDHDLLALDPVVLRRRVGMVFQRPTPFPGTVMENLFAAAPLTPEQAEKQLHRVGLASDLLDRDALTLSGGEAQRMCLARTLATGCSVLLADEITSSLDPDATAHLEQLARALAAGGTTVLWVTHDAAQGERLADHLLTIEGGRVVE
jgi:putative ABC transport system ATP-binding protein